jgi:hypothetical protein
MFQNDNNKNTNQTDLDQATTVNAEKITVHSMLRDLEELKTQAHPEKNSKPVPSTPQKELPKNPTPSPFQKPEPAKVVEKKAEPVAIPTPIAIKSPEKAPMTQPIPPKNPEKMPAPEKKPTTPMSKENKKNIVVLGTILAFCAFGFAGYYYWLTNTTPSVQPEVTTPTPPIEVPVKEPVVVETPASKFSTEKPNYLNVDIQAATKETIKATLIKYAADIQAENITTPVEFSLADLQNNPITFAAFAEKAGIVFSKPLLTGLGDNFSLFIYTDQGKSRVGLAISIKNSSALKANMLKEEPVLATELDALLLAPEYTLEKNKLFASSAYSNTDIRYCNITSPENISIDYALSGDALLIGTSKMTLRSILDKITIARISATFSAPPAETTPITQTETPNTPKQ